jgi:hypothetical protein
MTDRNKENGPRAVAAATEARVVLFRQGTAPDSPSQTVMAIQPAAEDFPLGVIWEREHRGELLRFSITEHNNSRYADLRRFFQRGGQWLHGNKGCTVPLSALQSLHESLGRYLAANESGKAQDAA